MKISELTRIWDSKPRIVRANESDIVHIVERDGERREQYHTDRRSITNCNRLMKWPHEERKWGDYRLCPTCGGDNPGQTFLNAEERGNQWAAAWNAKRDSKRAMEEAELKAELNWTETWKRLDQSIIDHVEIMIESGTALIPIKKADLAWLRSRLSRMIDLISAKDLKSEAEVAAWHRAHHLLNDVLVAD